MININKLILALCIGLIVLGVIIFIKYLKKMLSGKCCEGCENCIQKNNCSNLEDSNLNIKNLDNKK